MNPLDLSDIIGLQVHDSEGVPLARIADLVIRGELVAGYPYVTGLVAAIRRRRFFIPWDMVGSFDEGGIRLRSSRLSLRAFERREGEVLLGRDVLDRQLVDIEGRRVVRANDIQFRLTNNRLMVVAVDVSPRAIVRRVLPRSWRRQSEARTLIDWADLEIFGGALPTVKLRVPHEKLARLHPVEIARIVDSLSYRQSAELVESLDIETAADALEEISPERQAELLESMDEERAADILEEMEPDDAADALSELDEEKIEALLDKMDPEDAAEVRELLSYEEDTAGGVMTTDLVAVPAGISAGEAIARIRGYDEVPDLFYHVYVVDNLEDYHLLGLLTLQGLLLADAHQVVDDLMQTDMQSASPSADARAAARTIADYNLLSLPVIDDDNVLLGVITVDDAMDLLLPDGWKRHIPRVFG